MNKKELHRLSTIDDLQQLLAKATAVGVRMEEVQHLKVILLPTSALNVCAMQTENNVSVCRTLWITLLP